MIEELIKQYNSDSKKESIEAEEKILKIVKPHLDKNKIVDIFIVA